MKGISLSINVVVGMIIVALVLVVVAFFFTTNTVTQMTAADATKIFIAACLELKCGTPTDLCKENLAMSIMHGQDFKTDFFKACNILYGGDESNAFLCFDICGNCIKPTGDQKTELENIRNNALQNIGAHADECINMGLLNCADKYCTV